MMDLAPTEVNADSDTHLRGRRHFIEPIIVGFIPAYEYAICLVLVKDTDKRVARRLILVW
jgi:hypothetical protein